MSFAEPTEIATAEYFQDATKSGISQHEKAIGQGVGYRWSTFWEAPTRMIGLLLVGGALALGHHFFYKSLNDTKTPNTLPQQLNFAYGATFAFLTKASLIDAVATAYTQYMWFSLRTEFATVSTIDAKFSALSSIFSVLDFGLLLRPQTGFMLAVVAWLLPITAIVTPATLAVTQEHAVVIQPRNVPNVNFSSLPIPPFRYSISNSLDRLALLVISGGEIPSVSAFLPNTTYSVDVVGPSLQCESPSDTIREIIDEVFFQMSGLMKYPNGSTAKTAPDTVYMGFSPSSSDSWPFDAAEQLVSNKANWSDFFEFCIQGSDPCSFTDPSMYGQPVGNTSNLTDPVDTSNALWLRLGQTRLACSIQKTQYKIDFDTRASLTSTLNYTFTKQGVFNVNMTHGLELNDAKGYLVATQALLDSSLGQPISQDSFFWRQTTPTIRSGEDTWDGLVKNSSGAPFITASDLQLSRHLSLAALIEEMSRNVTLSFFTQPEYLSYNTSVLVSATHSSNRYKYNAHNLILAYAIAFSVSAVCVSIGLFAYHANGSVSCNASFSAILCATRNTVLDILARQYYRGPFVVDPEFKKTKLRLGFFQHRALSDDTAHAIMGFGVSGQVAEGKRGYSRLKAS